MPQYEFDFTGAPPAQGSLGSDVIPAGKYRLRVEDFVDGTTKAGDKRMVTIKVVVAQGEQTGKVLRDNFVLGGEQKFGAQRMHAFVLACGFKVPAGKFKLSPEKVIGKLVDADVKDDMIQANERYDARPTSRIDAYYTTSGVNPAAAAAAAATTAAPAAEEAPAPAPAPAVAKPPTAAAPVTPAAAAVVEELGGEEASISSIAEATDDLFS